MERPLKVVELDHVVLRCRDQQRAFDFYVQVLGLVEERRIEQIGLIQLRAGQSMIDLIPATGPRDENFLNVDHVCLGIEVESFEKLLEFLRSQGVEVIGEPSMRYGARGYGRSIYIRDPENNVVELKEKPAA
jgi:glyoxylase I family protein